MPLIWLIFLLKTFIFLLILKIDSKNNPKKITKKSISIELEAILNPQDNDKVIYFIFQTNSI